MFTASILRMNAVWSSSGRAQLVSIDLASEVAFGVRWVTGTLEGLAKSRDKNDGADEHRSMSEQR